MNLKYYWFCYREVISPRICDAMIELLHNSNKKRASIGLTRGIDGKEKQLTKEEKKFFNKTRKSTVAFSNDKWLYRYTHPWIDKANKDAGWNFQWNMSEPCQLTEYGQDQFYNWHVDQHPDLYTEGNMKGLTRKLSSVLVLNNATDYEGGKLECCNRSEKKKNYLSTPEPMKYRGSIVIFPSFVWHKVHPVTKGTRYSLTNWHCGNPYV